MKRIISLMIITAVIISSLTILSGAVNSTDNSDYYPSQISVLYSKENGFELATVAPISADDTHIVEFIQDEYEFYKPKFDEDFSDDFRLVLQDDNTLLPVNEVEIDLNSLDSYHDLINVWGYDENSEIMKDLYALITNHDESVQSVTVYVTPNLTPVDTLASNVVVPQDYTKTVNGKTVKTIYIKVDGVSGSGGQTIIRHGRNGVTDADKFKEVTVTLSQNRSRLFTMLDVLGFFGETFIDAVYEEWKDPPATTKPYVNEVLNYSNIVRFTNVIENGMEYTGCISNRVYADCNLVHYGTGVNTAPQVMSANKISQTFTSSKYYNSAAEQTAVNNYQTTTVIDRIETVYVQVTYPSGTGRFSERIKY